MPVYSYHCDNCGFRFERTQKFTDSPVSVCPNCHKKRVRKLLTSPSIVFKGSGWYSTDHRSPSGASSGSSSGSQKSTDSKDGKDGKPPEKAAEKTESKASSGDD